MSEDKAYKDGDIVWVKLGNNWWPGEVIDAHRHPDGIVTNIKRKLYCIVKFFNENAYEYVSNVKQIYPFQCAKKPEFLKKGLSLYNSGNKFMEKFPEDVEVAERLTRHQVPLVFINDRPDSIVKAILGQPLVLNCDDEYCGSSDYREKRKSSESITKIINLTPTKPSTPALSSQQQNRVENVETTTKYNNIKNDSISLRTSFGREQSSSSNNTSSTTATFKNNNYQCNICDFSSVRQNVMILHRKMHSSRNGQNTSLNRSNTKVNTLAPATTTPLVVKTSAVPMPAMQISSVTSPLNTPALDFSNSKTNDASSSTTNSSANDSSIIIVTDTSTSSDAEISPIDSQELQIRRSMRRTTKTSTETGSAGAAHCDVTNGSTESIDLPETKPIKKIPKKRDFVNLNLMQDDEITSLQVLDLQTDITNITEAAAATSRPATPQAQASAEEIRKMLLEDWSDDDETPDHDNKVASENRKRTVSNAGIVLSSPGPALTSIPCSDYKSTRIRNIPKKDRRDVILHDFSGELSLHETEKEPELTQRDAITVEENSNSSAVEVIEDHQPVIIMINDEEVEVAEEVVNQAKDFNNKKMNINSPRRNQYENVEPNDRSAIVTSILSCFDFQASDDEDHNNDSSANATSAGNCTATTAHFKKKYLSSEKSQTFIKDARQQQQNDDMAEKDQQLTAEIEKLLAITKPISTDLLTSSNSIEECLSVKDLPIKERGKRIFKSRNRSRIEEKSTNSLSTTDDSLTKEFSSPNKLDSKQTNDPNKAVVETLTTSLGEAAEIVNEKSLEDITETSSILIRRSEDNAIDTSKSPIESVFEVIVHSAPDTAKEGQQDDVGIVNKADEELSFDTKNEMPTDTTKETSGEILDVIPYHKSPPEIIVEPLQESTNNESMTVSNEEMLMELSETCEESTVLSVVPQQIENEDIQIRESSPNEELAGGEEKKPLAVVAEQENSTSREDNNGDENGGIQLKTEESTKCKPSPEIDTLIKTNDKEVQITKESTHYGDSIDIDKQNIQNLAITPHHDDEMNVVEEEDTSIKEITVSLDALIKKQLSMSAQPMNHSKLSSLPHSKQEVRSSKLDEDTNLRQKQSEFSVNEFTCNRLITTTPPTDENSSMGASDTGAEFGSPTSMLSEERLPTFPFNRNDTPQREIEITTTTTIDTASVNKEINQIVDDNDKGNDQGIHKNDIHAAQDAVCESKRNLKIYLKGNSSSNSSNGKYNSEMITNENDNSTSLSTNNNLTSKEQQKSVDFSNKHMMQKLSQDSAEIEDQGSVRKSPIECQQHKNRHTRHSTRFKENKASKETVESVELSLEKTATASEDNILNINVDQSERIDNNVATADNILNISVAQEDNAEQSARIESNVVHSIDNIKLRPQVSQPLSEESVENKNVQKPENESICSKESGDQTNKETQQESTEKNSSHDFEDLKNERECSNKDDSKSILAKINLPSSSSTQKELQQQGEVNTSKPEEETEENRFPDDVANANTTTCKSLAKDKKDLKDEINTDPPNKLDYDMRIIKKLNSESNVTPRSPKKRIGETILQAEAKHKKHDTEETLEKTNAVESKKNDNNKTMETETKLIAATEPSNDEKQSISKYDSTNVTVLNQMESVNPAADTKHEIIPPECTIDSSSKPKRQDLIIDCKTIVALPSKPEPDEKAPSSSSLLASEDKDVVDIEIENHIMAAEEVIVECESIPQENNTIEYDPETGTGTTINYDSINVDESNLTSVSAAENSEQLKVLETNTQTNLSQSVTVTGGEQETYLADKSTEDFLIEFDKFVNQTTTKSKTDNEEAIKAIDAKSNLKAHVPNQLTAFTTTSQIPDATTSVLVEATESRNNQSFNFQQKVAIKRRKTICFELAEYGLRVGESSRKRQVIDFEDGLPAEAGTSYRRTNERKMTLPDTIDFNSQFKSFKPRRRSSIEDNMRNFSKNWPHIDEDLNEANSSRLSSELAAKQIGIDSKGNKYIVIKDVSTQSQSTGSFSSIRKQRSDSSDSSLIMQRNCRTMKRKSSQSKSTTSTSKANTKASAASAIMSRRLSLPSDNSCRLFNTCVAIKPKITRDQVISSLNDNQLSTAQQQLMQLQQQQQQQQQIQSSSIMLNKQQLNRPRKTHRTQQQSSNQLVQQVQLQSLQQQQPQHSVFQQHQQQQLQQQLITQLPNQQNVLQFVTPQVQQQVQSANEGFIIATAASTEDDNVIDSNTQLIALPTQPYPGYTETFLLCKVNGNTCKPVDNVPLYLNHQLNELVPIPLDVLESAPKIATNSDGTIEFKHNNTQQLVVEDKTMEGHITIGETEITDAEISSQENVIHEQYLHDATLSAPVNEEEVTADMSTNNGILLNIEGQQVLLDAATFEHLLANPDANTQLISDDGTEYVLTHEVLQALHMQQQQEEQQQQQMMGITNATGSNNDIIAVAMAGSDLYGNGVLTIDTTQAVQLLDGNSGGMVFQQPPTAMVRQHLTPPAVVTNAVLDQSPIMSTLEVPSGSRMQMSHCITVPSLPIVAPSSVILGGSGGTLPNLDDSLAAIGVTAQTSGASASLGLPITVTDPNIASKVTSAGPLNEMLQFVSHRPATAAATAAAVAAAALAGESRIFND